MSHARRIISSSLSLALVLACNPSAPQGPGAGSDGPPAGPSGPVQPVVTDPVAEVSAVHGPAGVRTDDLAEGTFLGAGAKLRAGQVLVVPPGTLAELRLTGGTILRVNEDSRVTLPDGPQGRALDLQQGEVVAIVASGQPPLAVRAGGDTLDIATGEARAFARAGKRSYDVVYGTARLRADGQEVALTPGSHVETPLAAPSVPVQPEVSLRPLEDTAWSRTFEVAAAMVDAVPPGVGSLTARRAGTSTELHRLALVDQRVNVAISGRIARTEVEQTFYNEAGEVLEGTYRFPLPADASISGLSLLVGNTWMNAEMLEKERARSIFKQIVDATIPRDPALLEWEKGNIFKMKIFPIPGRGERKIRLSYTQVLPAVGDTLRYRYPIAGASSGATGSEIDNFAFNIAIEKSGLPADATIATPMARLERRESGDRVELSTTQQRFRPVHDLGVDIPLTVSEQRLHSETHLDRDGQAYFMLAMKPDLKLPASDRPVHYAFVLDRSHSMTPELWTVARSLLQAMSSTLGQDDRMTVLACDAACDVSPAGLQAPSTDTVAATDAFLDDQILAGASDIGGMMRAAAGALGDSPASAERVIVYLGDGNPSAGELAPDELLRHMERPLAGTRVQAVALGSRSDLLLLGALTRTTGGDLLRADAKDDIRGLVRELRLRAEVPVARDVALQLPKGMEYVHPQKLSALRPGDTVLLVGKLSQPIHGPIQLSARSESGQVVSDNFQVDLEPAVNAAGASHTHLPRTWASLEIDNLTATKGNSARAEIVDLSRQYTVLSRYTALLVLENDAMFREFNVVRQSARTTGWNGQLGGTGTVSGGVPVTTTTPTADTASAPRPQAEPSRSESAPVAAPPAPPAPLEAPAEPLADRSAPPRDAKDMDGLELAERQDPLANRSKGDTADLDDKSSSRFESADEESPASEKLPDIGLDANAGAGSSGPKTPPAAPKKEAEAKAKAPSKPVKLDRAGDAWDDLDSGGGWGGGPLGKGRGYYGPRWKISAASNPSNDSLGKLTGLQAAVQRDPTSRPAHRNLVRSAIRAGAPDAFAYATAWSQADPDHSPALLAVADLLAARSDPAALRAYGSAAEVNPFNAKLQTRLAEAYATKGDHTRACAHRRAVVSIDPARAEHHMALFTCLSRLGRNDLAADALTDGLARAKGNLGDLRTAHAGAVRLTKPRAPAGELKATLTWTGVADLDIVFVDSLGRRLSVLRPEGLTVDSLANSETIALGSARKPVTVEVSRFSGRGSVTGELKLKTPDVTRTYPFTIDQGTLRLASVSYTGW